MEVKSKILLAIILFVIISGTSCHNSIPHKQTNSADIPSSKSEALDFMQKLDATLTVTTDDTDVIQNIRSRMKGRLLSAGLPQNEIETWIKSPINH